MDVTIRNARAGDEDGCYFVESNCYTSEGASKERIAKRIRVFPLGFLMAEAGGQIVGITNGSCTNLEDINVEELKDMVGFDKDGKNVMIFSVAVLPDFQGKGIARLLLEKFIGVFRELGKEKILLRCKKKYVGLYEKFGFRLFKISRSRHGSFDWFEMALALR